jgi:transcriptional regulator with XRE-family HTH domain
MASFGEKLRHEREMRGITLREIADATKISSRFLQALEEDRLDVLPGGLFPRAFVKQYATFLGLDAVALLEQFAAIHGEAVVERCPAPPPERRFRLTAGHVILGVIALLLVVLSLRRSSPRPEPRARPEATSATVAATAVLPTDRVYPAPALAHDTVATASDALVLTMTAQQECWVEVRTDGTTVVNRVLAEGESQTLEARGEIVLSVGNAGGLRIRLNDRPALPLGRSGEVRKNIVITRQNLPSLVDQDRSAANDGQSG